MNLQDTPMQIPSCHLARVHNIQNHFSHFCLEAERLHLMSLFCDDHYKILDGVKNRFRNIFPNEENIKFENTVSEYNLYREPYSGLYLHFAGKIFALLKKWGDHTLLFLRTIEMKKNLSDHDYDQQLTEIGDIALPSLDLAYFPEVGTASNQIKHPFSISGIPEEGIVDSKKGPYRFFDISNSFGACFAYKRSFANGDQTYSPNYFQRKYPGPTLDFTLEQMGPKENDPRKDHEIIRTFFLHVIAERRKELEIELQKLLHRT